MGVTGPMMSCSIQEIWSYFSQISRDSALSALQVNTNLSALSWTVSATRYPSRAFRYAFWIPETISSSPKIYLEERHRSTIYTSTLLIIAELLHLCGSSVASHISQPRSHCRSNLLVPFVKCLHSSILRSALIAQFGKNRGRTYWASHRFHCHTLRI